MTGHYRICLRGWVSDRVLSPYLDEFTVRRTNATTTVSGPITDSAQLHGMITHFTAAGLDIIEMTSGTPLSDPQRHTTFTFEPNTSSQGDQP